MISGTRMKEKNDPAILKAFVSLSLSSSSLFLRCNPCFPLAYKRESRARHKGDRLIEARLDRTIMNPSNLELTRTQHKHTAEQ